MELYEKYIQDYKSAIYGYREQWDDNLTHCYFIDKYFHLTQLKDELFDVAEPIKQINLLEYLLYELNLDIEGLESDLRLIKDKDHEKINVYLVESGRYTQNELEKKDKEDKEYILWALKEAKEIKNIFENDIKEVKEKMKLITGLENNKNTLNEYSNYKNSGLCFRDFIKIKLSKLSGNDRNIFLKILLDDLNSEYINKKELYDMIKGETEYGATKDDKEELDKLKREIINYESEKVELLNMINKYANKNEEYKNSDTKIIEIETEKLLWLKNKQDLIYLLERLEQLNFIGYQSDKNKIVEKHFQLLDKKTNEIKNISSQSVGDLKSKIKQGTIQPSEQMKDIIKDFENKANENKGLE